MCELKSIPPWIILKAGSQHATWYQEPALFNKGYAIARSQNGWTTDEIGLRWLKEMFEPHSKTHSTGAKRLLILDGHGSHLTADFDAFCKEHAIICLCMPPHTSHLLQPLDVGVFGPLKRAYGKLVEEMMVAGNNHIDKEDFLSLYPPAREKVFTRENIRSGFAGAVIKNGFLKKLLSNFGHQHYLLLTLKAQSPLLFKHLRILVNSITRSAVYRGACENERFLVVQYLIFNILKKPHRWR